MAGSTSLQIPTMDSPAGPSRQHHSSTRPVSVTVQSSPAGPSPSTSRKQRASHTVVSSTGHNGTANGRNHEDNSDNSPPYTDVYNHPAALAYASAHPRRTIPKFGPYLLLQTLGEGEFGKVKLGLHNTWGEEVAVKLIRRGNVDSAVRMSKVEREIEVLRTLKHPNIVHKYIGIIIEYASGGELFDHILAHRYLREKDAAKLFSQLISGKIVHRDLKLENLLLDRHRNVIITDFGFANRFEHRADDLMQTSCGSPCYAAPELVISEGLYVGSAVDIWSCGVILYAMLAGYLPFDDDPANPDGDNINLLYKYIVNTPLSFPDYISDSARELLSMMLVPDPSRRASLEQVMQHPWLGAYHAPLTDPIHGKPAAFGRTVDELESAAMDQHHQKRLAYQKQMKAAAAAAAQANVDARAARTQSHRPEGTPMSSSLTSPPGGGRSHSTEPAAFYETPTEYSNHVSSPPVPASASGRGPKSSYGMDGDDPFAAPPGTFVPTRATPVSSETPAEKKKARHTVQVEYDGSRPSRREREKERERDDQEEPRERRRQERSRSPSQRHQSSSHTQTTSTPTSERRRGSQSNSVKPVPVSPAPLTPSRRASDQQRSASTPRAKPTPVSTVDPPSIILASPPDTPIKFVSDPDAEEREAPQSGSGSQSSSGSKHKRGMSSVDRLAKIFNGHDGSSTDPGSPPPSSTPSNTSGSLLTPSDKEASSPPSSGKKSRRNTLTVMVEPFKSTMKNRNKGRMASTPISATSDADEKRGRDTSLQPRSAVPCVWDPNGRNQASTNKAFGVMQWFRNKSKARDSVTVGEPVRSAGALSEDEEKLTSQRSTTPTQNRYRQKNATSTGTVNQTNAEQPPSILTTPRSASRSSTRPTRTTSTDTSTTTPSFVTRFRNSVTVGGVGGSSSERSHAKAPAGQLRTHHGAVDQSTVTTRPPPEVMKHVQAVLINMGVEVQFESEFKFRCIRAKRKKMPTSAGSVGFMGGSGNGLAAFNMVGSAASNGVDKRGLPLPSHQTFSGSTGMLRGLLMRRQSSQVSTGVGSYEDDTPNSSLVMTDGPIQEPLYGDHTEDVGDEVKFSVELTKLSGLNDTYSLDIRRMKGNLRSYKFLYDTIRIRAELS
ncbi:Pkinase-domain-containing protein [Gymnopus androsaceus JB14]|uniref:non-specific serine/threonine protein kinase n=1 Tax=Gymnopus androsaceus JB14 TaxID=1447944 RepID=A0A6A4HSY6_9AGAR|nr:Pkinase-domain-containing protein [Gymnopus androsaceus JB14]